MGVEEISPAILKKGEKTMKINFLLRHVAIDDKTKTIIEKKIAKLDKFFESDKEALVTLRKAGDTEILELTIHSVGMIFRSEVKSESFRAYLAELYNRRKSVKEPYIPEERKPKKPEEPRHKYGEYGWVKLTDAEYDRLLRDLGHAELERCIRYVDESAQSNNNRNKWTDWNLVVRKCHRDRWGVKSDPHIAPSSGTDRLMGMIERGEFND